MNVYAKFPIHSAHSIDNQNLQVLEILLQVWHSFLISSNATSKYLALTKKNI